MRTSILLLLALPVLAGAQQTARQSGTLGIPQGDSLPDFIRRATTLHPQPGDRVWFHALLEPKLSDTVMIDERGDVVLPKIGLINASSLTIEGLRDTVRTRIAEFLRDSPIELVVLRRVSVNGQVARPNVYYVDVTTAVRDLIARAGGLTDIANANDVVVIRDGQRIRVRDWQQDRSTNSDLRSGDQVVVGRKSWISMNFLPTLSVMTGVVSLAVVLLRR
ncbi:MAG: polysaccharide biosynthesis/export family protein [Deltaproteobacteria bacterium]